VAQPVGGAGDQVRVLRRRGCFRHESVVARIAL
jgi:hypothetical protein